MTAYNLANNQIVVNLNTERYFFSYGTLIAKWTGTKYILDSYYWDYSRTTLKYLKQFLATTKSKKEIQQAINTNYYSEGNLQ